MASNCLMKLAESYGHDGSDSDDEENEKLPVPKELQDMFQHRNNYNNPTAHGGRVRGFSHVEGNWATFVYFNLLQNIPIQFLKENLMDHWNINEEFHVSLSRTFPIAQQSIQPLVQSLKNNLNNFSSFEIDFEDCEIRCYTNDEKSRSFIGIELSQQYATNFINLINSVDTVLSEYGCERYYTERSIHVSVAWSLGDQSCSEDLNKLLATLNQTWKEQLEEEAVISLNTVFCKCGNKLFQIPLQ